MAASEYGPWQPLGLDAVAQTFAGAPFRWWISGGRALSLHLGRTWRVHEDTDLGVVRGDLAAVYDHLIRVRPTWQIHLAAAGVLSRWDGRALVAEHHENNLWCRDGEGGPWLLDIQIGGSPVVEPGPDPEWRYRRDPGVRRPWERAVLHSATGLRLPYLAPELQLLFKSDHPRPRDDQDAAEVIPELDHGARAFLAAHLPDPHPWRSRLSQ